MPAGYASEGYLGVCGVGVRAMVIMQVINPCHAFVMYE